MNRTFLVGFVGKDPEIKAVGEKKLYKLNLAVSDNYKDKNGQWINQTHWIPIATFKDISDITKGSKILVEGSINVREWTDKEGKKQKTFEVNAQNIIKLHRDETQKDNNKETLNNISNDYNITLDDDLPF